MSKRIQETEKTIMAGMSKRIQVTLPDRVADDLQKWADYDGRPTANLAAYLIERAITEAKKEEAEWTVEENEPPPQPQPKKTAKGKGSVTKRRGKAGGEE
jgi:hypothetical protein